MFLFITKNDTTTTTTILNTPLGIFFGKKFTKIKISLLKLYILSTVVDSTRFFLCYLCFVLYTVKYLWYLPTYHQLQYMLPDCCVWDNIQKKTIYVSQQQHKKNIEENTVYKTLRIGNSSYNNSKEKKIPRKQHGFGLEC